MRAGRKNRGNVTFLRVIELLLDIIVMVFTVFLTYCLLNIVGSQGNAANISDILRVVLQYLSNINILISHIFYIAFAVVLMIIYESSIVGHKFSGAYFSLLLSLILSLIFLLVLNYTINNYDILPLAFLIIIVIQAIVFAPLKYFEHRFVLKILKMDVMVIGNELELSKYLDEFTASMPLGRNLKYVYIIGCNQDANTFDRIKDYIDQTDIVYLLPDISNELKNLIVKYTIGHKDIQIALVPDIYEVGVMKSQFEMIGDILVSKIEPLRINFVSSIFKRTFDILTSLFAVIILSPLLILVSLMIYMYDKGPVIFKQIRVTKDDRKFKIFKFRTMIVDAEKETGAIQARENDSRITKIGKYLRKTRIDELPQFFNVLLGQMSIVGPRSLRIEEVEEFSKKNPDFRYRLNVKAGITGMAQIYGNYATKQNDKLRLDLYYIHNYSFIFDIKLILLTLKIIFDKASTQGILDCREVNIDKICEDSKYEVQIIRETN
ncbi:MAG: sugar transferase [Firmicutes bacterium]|nr:sugar transferase [Bacillota bacterium]